MKSQRAPRLFVAMIAACCLAATTALAGQPAGKSESNTGDAPAAAAAKTADEFPSLKRLSPDGKVWLDAKNKRVVMLGEVCLREGQLEMFACPQGTKEHESIVAVPTKAFVVHAALIALGAQPGSPVEFDPAYKPASGPRIDVTVYWSDAAGKRRQATAQDWIRNVKTGKAMTDYWVFTGSGFWNDDRTGEVFYKAEDGDFICVSNFASAMLDLPIPSSDSNAGLLFEAFTERIPPLGTKVTVVLTPRLAEKAGGATAPRGK